MARAILIIFSVVSFILPFLIDWIGSAKDPVNFAGMMAVDILKGDMQVIHWDSVGESFILDVRNPQEFEVESVPGALNIPLPQLRSRDNELPRDREILVLCRSA